MDILLQQVVNGLTLGCVYAVVALGYTMVYGIIQLINFAHGEVVMIGCMVAFSVIVALAPSGMPPLAIVTIGTLVAVPVCMAVGYVVERVAYRPLRNAPRLNVLITAIGVSLLLQNLGQLDKDLGPFNVFFGTRPQPMPPLINDAALATIGGVRISTEDVAIIVLAAGLMVGLQWLVYRTRLGRAMRAVAQDMQGASMVGINVNQIFSYAFGLSVVLAGIAGILLARRMLIPITALSTGARRLGAREFDHRIDVHTADELEELATQFNSMAGQLQNTYASLEAKVEERLTRELRFDPDVWIVEVEDRAGRHFLENLVG